MRLKLTASSLILKRFLLALRIFISYLLNFHSSIIFLLQLENVISNRTSKIHSLEKRINDIIDRTYKKFSESVGVKNIREYEENHLKAIEKMSADIFNLRNQQSKLKYQYELLRIYFL